MIETVDTIDIRELTVREPIVFKTRIQETLEELSPNIWREFNQLINQKRGKLERSDGPKEFLPALEMLLNTMWRTKVIAPEKTIDTTLDKTLERRIQQACSMIPDEEHGWENYLGIPAYAKLLFPKLEIGLEADSTVFARLENCLTEDSAPDGSDAIIDEEFIFMHAVLFPQKVDRITNNPEVLKHHQEVEKNLRIFPSMLHEYLVFSRLFHPQVFKARGGVKDEEWEKMYKTLTGDEKDMLEDIHHIPISLAYNMTLLSAPDVRWTDGGIEIQREKPISVKSPLAPIGRKF